MASLLLISNYCIAQDGVEPQSVDGSLNPSGRLDEIRAAPNGQPNVIAQTISPEEIDRAVLNRLAQEISQRPEVAQIRLGVDESELQDIFVTLSNAQTFINGSEIIFDYSCDKINEF